MKFLQNSPDIARVNRSSETITVTCAGCQAVIKLSRPSKVIGGGVGIRVEHWIRHTIACETLQ